MKQKSGLVEPSYTKFLLSMIAMFIVLLVISFFALMLGHYDISIMQTLSVLFPSIFPDVEVTTTISTVIWNIRMPRVLLAVIVGAGLATSGAAFQGLFANPLATADTLGVAAGASFGAALGILFGFNGFTIQLLALAFGIVAVLIVYALSSSKDSSSLVMIVLSGLVVSALFSAFVGLIKYVADPNDQLPSITFWLMGSLASANYEELFVGAPLIIVGMTIIFLLRWKINALTLQEDEAKALGIPVKQLRVIIIFSATLVTAAVISICGQISWIGLLVPHVARMLYGNNHRHVVPASIFIGAILMIVIDTLARTLTTAEIPVSILTAIIGAPVFVALLRKTGGIKG